MTLNSTGPISLGGSTTGQSVNLELGKSATAQVSFNDTDVRTLTATSAGAALTMPTNFYGKSYIVVTVGSLVVSSKVNLYYYGYDGALGGPGSFGSISGGVYNGATVKAVYSSGAGTVGNATSYSVIFSGNRAAGFFSTLRIGGTLTGGTLGSPTYNSTNNETAFNISLGASTTTLFGTTNGVTKTVVIA